MAPIPLAELWPGATPAAVDLLATLVVLEPTRRATAEQALAAPFFSQPDAPRAALAQLARETAARVAAKPAVRPPWAVDDDSDDDWGRGPWDPV